MEPTFIYDGTEIIKTSRKAKRKLHSGKTDELIEITPKDKDVGTWRKWVREDDLYEVLPS